MSVEAVTLRLACESAEMRARLDALSREIPFVIERTIDLSCESLDVEGCAVLLIEQRALTDGLAERTFSINHANGDMLSIVLVTAPRENVDAQLLAAGALDVVDDGPGLRAQLTRALAAARRIGAMQSERARLTSDLAHREVLSALGTLAAGVGHEINNPCGAILANATAAKSDLEALLARPRILRVDALDTFAADWLESLDDCIHAARRIHQVVKSLGALSRRSEVLTPELVDVNEEIKLVLRLIGKEAQSGAQFELTLAPDLPKIRLPMTALGQIVTNLTVNALQALNESRPQNARISIRTMFDAASVLLEISDNGNGIAPEILGKIFEPFFTTKAAGEGTGLGLSITRALVERSGGEILAANQPRGGACFRVVFPRSDSGAGAHNGVPAIVSPKGKLRVLIVDDDELSLRAIERSLRAEFDCTCVTSAADAIVRLRGDDSLDAVLSDVVMPGTSGVGLYDQLCASFPRLAARTVFISGGISSPALLDRLTRTGRPLVGKPVEPRELARVLRTLDSSEVPRA